MMTNDTLPSEFAASRRWRAKWVWGEGQPAQNVFCLFRADVALDFVPDTVRCFIAADTRYQLYINGRFVGRGAPQSQPFLQYYDEREVASFFRPGANSVGVIVNHLGTLPDTRGGLLAEFVDADGKTLLATDTNWRVIRGAAWEEKTFRFRMNLATPFQEFFDARQMPQRWSESGFDDANWRRATVITGRYTDRPPAVEPWIRLVPRDIPFMTDNLVLPQSVTVEECLSLRNRIRAEDLSISLSQAGTPVRHSRIEGAENLCRAAGQTTVQGSTAHLQDHTFDGIYDPCIVVDFGRVITAYPRLELDGVAGGVIEIGYAERLVDGHFNNAIEGQFADRLTMRDGPQTYQPFTWKAFRFLKLRFRECAQPVTIHALQAEVTTYPFEERGRFKSADETLNAVWDISRYTLRLCSNEFIMDTPWREQGQWLGDVASVTLGGLYACFGDTRLAAKFLRQSAASQRPMGLLSNITNSVDHWWKGTIPDYSLWWIMGVWNHYLYTGEARWIHDLYPAALKVMQAHLPYLSEHGLIEEMPLWVFIDWAAVDNRGECAAYNAIFYGALEALKKMARFKNDAESEEKITHLRTLMKQNFGARLFDPQRGCFADARVDEELSPKTSEHANMAAIGWGLCDDDVSAAIIRRFYEDRSITYTEAQPFFTTVVLQALDRVGRFDLALQIIRERWGERMVARGATSTYEEWTMNGSWRYGDFQPIMRTLSHAWSAHPAEFLIRNLLGLEIIEPGCRKVRLRPQSTFFDYDVSFPTPQGSLDVRCRNGEVQINAPDEVEVVML